MSDTEREQEPFDEQAERERSDEAPWEETQDQPHEGEEGQSEEVA
jgi:hypothetical protein